VGQGKARIGGEPPPIRALVFRGSQGIGRRRPSPWPSRRRAWHRGTSGWSRTGSPGRTRARRRPPRGAVPPAPASVAAPRGTWCGRLSRAPSPRQVDEGLP